MSILDCRIVMVRPRDPNNIGAAARAMKNFGFHDLSVVSPHPPIWDEVVSAVNSMDIVRTARVFESLVEAVADRTLVIGTADPTRSDSGNRTFNPRDLARLVRQIDHKIAIVFGPEKHGLTNEDLSFCHRTMSIPTQPDCPSMNLGQAVAVCCYELASDDNDQNLSTVPVDSASAGDVEIALELALQVLRRADYIIPGTEPGLRLKLRRRLLGLSMSKNEVNRLTGALRKIGRQ